MIPAAARSAPMSGGREVRRFLLAFAFCLAGCAPEDAPTPVFVEGKIAEIKNCPPVDAKYERQCLLLACEAVLFERATIPAHARIVATRSEINFSHNPSLSRHMVKFPEADKFRYAMCEMNERQIVFVRELTARDQDW